jgi:uncharacterized protein Yka (UPF0111/DUF47 family)
MPRNIPSAFDFIIGTHGQCQSCGEMIDISSTTLAQNSEKTAKKLEKAMQMIEELLETQKKLSNTIDKQTDHIEGQDEIINRLRKATIKQVSAD